MNILITGANGFLGKNLCVFLSELTQYELIKSTRSDTPHQLAAKVLKADFIFHLAGVNRPESEIDFKIGNTDLTRFITTTLIAENLKTPIAIASSIQASLDNPYGLSKKHAEQELENYQNETGGKIFIFRLPNVFGKWSKPNYNSVVSTFCYNVLNNLPISVNDPSTKLSLVYVDDVCRTFLSLLDNQSSQEFICNVNPTYSKTLGEIASLLAEFKSSRNSLITENVGSGFTRALYSTYISYMTPAQFDYSVQRHSDKRGTFVEMIKTKDSGQVSYFTAKPGVTRGGHYHHTKTEKFLVIKGTASFKFKHIVTEQFYELIVTAEESSIVETAPGWSHDITNVGDDELIVMLWANEIFDRLKPDTITREI